MRRAAGSVPSRRTLARIAATLRALLPAPDAEYVRTVRSEHELFAASGGRDPNEFRATLTALCREARVLTLAESSHAASHVAASLRDGNCVPGAPESRDESVRSAAFRRSEPAEAGTTNSGLGETGLREHHYQPAHDSLLPPVRAWLQLKQQERWWGRHAQRMIVIRGPVEFDMGSPDTEYARNPNETRKRVRIERSFAISATEITKLQFCACLGLPPAPDDDSRPATAHVNWNNAAWYCVLLSAREGMPDDQLAYHPGSKVKRCPYGSLECKTHPETLQRIGYRLPTEEEWECACRAGTATSRFFGETAWYIDDYAWTFDASPPETKQVGLLRPNRFGLFDTYGNVSEWCLEVSRRDAAGNRIMSMRGGSAWSAPDRYRSAARYDFGARRADHRSGFRIARTLPDPPPSPNAAP